MEWSIGCWGRPGGNAVQVADHLSRTFKFPVIDYQSNPGGPVPQALVIVVPNLGDGEIQEDVELFVKNRSEPILNYCIVELGNYYGFDDWGFGAADRIRQYFTELGKNEATGALSLDTLPLIDWNTLKRWCAEVTFETAASGSGVSAGSMHA